jgi:hypothetical protein
MPFGPKRCAATDHAPRRRIAWAVPTAANGMCVHGATECEKTRRLSATTISTLIAFDFHKQQLQAPFDLSGVTFGCRPLVRRLALPQNDRRRCHRGHGDYEW